MSGLSVSVNISSLGLDFHHRMRVIFELMECRSLPSHDVEEPVASRSMTVIARSMPSTVGMLARMKIPLDYSPREENSHPTIAEPMTIHAALTFHRTTMAAAMRNTIHGPMPESAVIPS